MRRLLLALSVGLVGVGCRYELELPYVVDDSFEDFRAGTLQDSGAKLYVSARGNVQLVDRLDLDADGWPDLAFAPGSYGGDFRRSAVVVRSSRDAPHEFASASTLTVPTHNGQIVAGADLDADGYADLFVANAFDVATSRIDSYLYLGGPGGLSEQRRVSLPTVGALGVATADLDRNGYLDLVVGNSFDKGAAPVHSIASYVYWGGPDGFNGANRLPLPTDGASGVVVADLDEDGALDLVFGCAERDAGSTEVEKRSPDSLIYWGPTFRETTALPTFAAIDASVADLDEDGALDLVFVNRRTFLSKTGTSTIYWGDPANRRGYGASRKNLPTPQSHGVSIGDLDRDGDLDIVFAASLPSDTLAAYSFIYWGPVSKIDASGIEVCIGKCGVDGACLAGCFNVSSPAWQGLPTEQAITPLIADLNGDGASDLVFARGPGRRSWIFWGPWNLEQPFEPGRLHFRGLTEVPSGDAFSVHYPEPGSVRDRSAVQSFVSRPHRLAGASPRPISLAWEATTPAETHLRFQLRSAATEAGLASALWLGPKSQSDFYEGSPAPITAGRHEGRYLQYRAFFEARTFASSPVLDRVVVRYR
jgi:hypothetical protein